MSTASRCCSFRRRYCASIGVSLTPVPATPVMRASDLLALLGEVVDEQVLAEPVGARVEGAAAVDAGHALDERAEARAVVEHEGVDGDAEARDPFHLLQRLLRGAHADAAEAERPLAEEPALLEIRRRLAVR